MSKSLSRPILLLFTSSYFLLSIGTPSVAALPIAALGAKPVVAITPLSTNEPYICHCPPPVSPSILKTSPSTEEIRTIDTGDNDDDDDENDNSPIPPLKYWTIMGVTALLVLLAGIFAGLTIGLMSLDETNLCILKASGTPTQRAYAERIEPIRRNPHLLLVTLLLGNTIVNETLPILMRAIHLDGYQAVLISTVLIVIFGEIIPQAVCAKHGLLIGAFFAWPVRILTWMIFPVVWPTARVLDFVLGKKRGVVYRRAELKELVSLHCEDVAGPLTRDEVSIMRAVLELRDKNVTDVMMALENVFMLPFEGKLDNDLLQKIIQSNHSRIPIYHGTPSNIIGLVHVNQLLIYTPTDEIPLSSIKLQRLPHVSASTPLFDILRVFGKRASHICTVVDGGGDTVLGIVTLKDVVRELIGVEIIEETDIYLSKQLKIARTIRKSPHHPAHDHDHDHHHHIHTQNNTSTITLSNPTEQDTLIPNHGNTYGTITYQHHHYVVDIVGSPTVNGRPPSLKTRRNSEYRQQNVGDAKFAPHQYPHHRSNPHNVLVRIPRSLSPRRKSLDDELLNGQRRSLDCGRGRYSSQHTFVEDSDDDTGDDDEVYTQRDPGMLMNGSKGEIE